jgi:hypothetical protein
LGIDLVHLPVYGNRSIEDFMADRCHRDANEGYDL